MNDKPTMGDLAEVLFAAAVAQGRADALKASAVKMQRELRKPRNPPSCKTYLLTPNTWSTSLLDGGNRQPAAWKSMIVLSP
jgi:hypothetical protein